MNPAVASIVAGLLNFAFEVWRTHTNKPKDWIPSTNDYLELLAEIDAATPDHEKEEARKRLGL